ncbi:hypothetical protein AB6A68_13875 [Ferrimicrobium acidiphilum]|uniref:Uncharacterized protein n=2 Tax=Ferrimicrobium acidiphilum TaxID=121039 RepID=A0ABV3Y5Q6_9ACTN
MSVDPDEFDLIINTWALQQADHGHPIPVSSSSTGSKMENESETTDSDTEGSNSIGAGEDLVGVVR